MAYNQLTDRKEARLAPKKGVESDWKILNPQSETYGTKVKKEAGAASRRGPCFMALSTLPLFLHGFLASSLHGRPTCYARKRTMFSGKESVRSGARNAHLPFVGSFLAEV